MGVSDSQAGQAEDDKLAEIHSLFGILADSELSQMTDDEIKHVIYKEKSERYSNDFE